MKYDFDTTNTLRGFCQKFIICPNQWLKYNISVNLNWNCIKYERQNLNNLPDQSGVYAFVAKPCVANLDECNYLLYIGKAQDQTLKIRCSQYLSELKRNKPRLFVLRMFHCWGNHLYLYYAQINVSDIRDIEDTLLSTFIPPLNTRFSGKLENMVKDIYRS